MEEGSLFAKILGIILYLGLVLLAIFVIQKIADLLITRYFDTMYKKAQKQGKAASKKRYTTLSRALQSVVTVILWIIAFFIILTHFGVNVAVILSGAGALGIFLGLAGQDMFMDFYVGAMVLLEDQYRVGDVIKIDANHSGLVEDISLRTVQLRDLDGNLHVVPHSQSRSIINMTYGFSRVKLDIGVAYNSDQEKVEKIINQVGEDLAEDEGWKDKFVNNIVFDRLVSFDDSQITVRCIGDVKPGDQWTVSGEFNKRLKSAFDKNGIEIPFPQRVIHTVSEKSK